jgi:hypothetical protein
MKELTSNHDDLDKRLAIFFGLGAFIMSALVGLERGYSLEGFLLQGVVALIFATLAGWAFGYWLRGVLKTQEVKESVPENVEVRVAKSESLAEGGVVTAPVAETVIEGEAKPAISGQVVNFTLPELSPLDFSSEEASSEEAVAAK